MDGRDKPAMTNQFRSFRTKFRSWPRRSRTSSSSRSRSSTPVLGDIEGNVERAREARARAAEAGADLIAFTELYLTGYPIEDLVLKPALQQAAREACEALARDTKDGGPAMLMGLPWGEAPVRL